MARRENNRDKDKSENIKPFHTYIILNYKINSIVSEPTYNNFRNRRERR